MVMAVNVGDIWALPGLSCHRWHILGICLDAWGEGGEARPPRDDNFKLATHSLRRGQEGGALRGRSPRTREGRIGPTAQKRGESKEE